MNLHTLASNIKPSPVSVGGPVNNLSTFYYGQSNILNTEAALKPTQISTGSLYIGCDNSTPSFYTDTVWAIEGFGVWLYNDSSITTDLQIYGRGYHVKLHLKGDNTLYYESFPGSGGSWSMTLTTPLPTDQWVYISLVGNINNHMYMGWKTDTDEAYITKEYTLHTQHAESKCPTAYFHDYKVHNFVFSPSSGSYQTLFQYFDVPSRAVKPGGWISGNEYDHDAYDKCPPTWSGSVTESILSNGEIIPGLYG